MSNLCSPRLQFTRDARRVVCATAGGIAIHAAGSRDRIAIAARGDVVSLAAFADQLWVASATELVRWDLRGRTIGAPIAIGDAGGDLVPALAGPAAATLAARLWVGGCEPTAALSAIACGADVLPFVGKKTIEVVRYRGERIARLGAAAWRLPGTTQLVAAAPLFDGTGVVLFVRRDGRAEAWTSTLAGAIHHVVELPDGELRLASRAGIAVVRTAPDAAVAFDLRYGRRIGDAALPGPAGDFAIDPDGKYLAQLDVDGELAITTLHDALKIANSHHAQQQQQESETLMPDSDFDVDETIEQTKSARADASSVMGILGGTDLAPAVDTVNGAVEAYEGVNEIRDGKTGKGALDTASGALEVIGGVAEVAEDSGLDEAGPVGQVASAVKGDLEVGEGVEKIATDDGYGGQTLDGIDKALHGAGDAAGAFGPEAAMAGKAFNGVMDLTTKYAAPVVFGDMKNTGSKMEDIPEGGFQASTGNSVLDWIGHTASSGVDAVGSGIDSVVKAVSDDPSVVTQ